MSRQFLLKSASVPVLEGYKYEKRLRRCKKRAAEARHLHNTARDNTEGGGGR